jgi:hypothetical protein
MTETEIVAHIRMPQALRVRLRVLAAMRGTSMRRLAVEAFEALLSRYAEHGVQTDPDRRPG